MDSKHLNFTGRMTPLIVAIKNALHFCDYYIQYPIQDVYNMDETNSFDCMAPYIIITERYI